MSDNVIIQQLLINEMKENIRDDPSAPLRRVYDQSVVVACRREYAPPAEEIPLFHQVASQLKRTKYKNVPPVPNDVEVVEINDVWRLTWDGDDYIAYQENDWGILIFATEHNLRFLSCHGRIIFVDGTFRSCPHPYNQILTVHALVQDHVVVLVIWSDGQQRHRFLPSSDPSPQNKILEVTNRRWRPTSVISDFEQASMTAFETEFPRITVKGCYFHLIQALWRAIQRYALVNLYRNSCGMKKCLKKVMALGFLLVALVRFNSNRLRQQVAIKKNSSCEAMNLFHTFLFRKLFKIVY